MCLDVIRQPDFILDQKTELWVLSSHTGCLRDDAITTAQAFLASTGPIQIQVRKRDNVNVGLRRKGERWGKEGESNRQNSESSASMHFRVLREPYLPPLPIGRDRPKYITEITDRQVTFVDAIFTSSERLRCGPSPECEFQCADLRPYRVHWVAGRCRPINAAGAI